MDENRSRAEATRLLGLAEKLLLGKDLNGSRDFAVLAQETDPFLEGSDQIVAVVDVLIAAQRRVNNNHDWYAILQVERGTDDLEHIKKQYRRLAMLLHPDKNKFAFADSAFKFVAAAWAVLSDIGKKSVYDQELSMFSRVDLVALKNQRGLHQQFRPQPEQQEQHQQRFPGRGIWQAANSGAKRGNDEARLSRFWTACPYCYNLFEYPRVYEGCCLKCQNCRRSFHAAEIPSLPPTVPGKEAYYCCWGIFPLGFVNANSENAKYSGIPNWAPSTAETAARGAAAAVPNNGGGVEGGNGFMNVPQANVNPRPVPRKRGRPRKNVQIS